MKENKVMRPSRNQAASHLPELNDSDLEAVSGGTGSEGEAGSPSPNELAQLNAATQEFALLQSTLSSVLESASEGMKTVARP